MLLLEAGRCDPKRQSFVRAYLKSDRQSLGSASPVFHQLGPSDNTTSRVVQNELDINFDRVGLRTGISSIDESRILHGFRLITFWPQLFSPYEGIFGALINDGKFHDA